MPRVLIVDDDIHILREVSELLREEGFDVITAGDGAEALLRLADATSLPSVILLDLRMPDPDGWELRKTQMRDPALAAIPVLAFSAMDLEPAQLVELGFAGSISKPFKIQDLLDTLARFP